MFSLVIHPKIEPGVINNDMIKICIEKYGSKGETGRLFTEEGTHMDEIPQIRLEFQNIIRIDHLWMLKSLTKLSLAHNSIEKIENLNRLPNLVELDLSFNKITEIQNLKELTKLEVLSLFSNCVEKLENMDELGNLFIFSIGKNLIEDFKEVIYLRRFCHLRSLCVKGNPFCNNKLAYDFIMSALPKIHYLDYKVIHDKDRIRGGFIYRAELKNLDEIDEQAENTRIAKEEYDSRVEFYALSFVEYLTGPELLERMFEKDSEGQMLLQLGGELRGYYEQYKANYVNIMKALVDFAQNAYNERQEEIGVFKELVEGALEKSILESTRALETFKSDKAPLLEDMNLVIVTFAENIATLQVLEPRVIDLGEKLNDLLFALWKKLMLIELTLFDQCEEYRVQFSVNMTEKVKRFQEVARDAFGKWRELDQDWTAKQMELLHKFISNRPLLAFLDPKSKLREILLDRDLTVDAVAQSSDNHMRFIDAREDVLMTKATTWKDNIVKGTNENEIKRNRARVLEISYFIDCQRQEWLELQLSLTDVTDAETKAIFGEIVESAADNKID